MQENISKTKYKGTILSTEELIARFSQKTNKGSLKIFSAAIILVLLFGFLCINFFRTPKDIDDSDIHITYVGIPLASTSTKTNVISIPTGTVKANPFLPYRTITKDYDSVSDVPKFDLVAPPETVNENSDAARVMDTIVSGILYDKFSPSAILNIEGNDYLVKKGDVVNNYKVLDITQNSVSVKLGNNTYKAGIGEILTEGTVNYNDVSNLSKKFGGERR